MNYKIISSLLAISAVLGATSMSVSAQTTSSDAFDYSSGEADVDRTNVFRVDRTDDNSNSNNSQKVTQNITPGRATRSGPSYIGVGGNIGLSGDTALGDSGFAIISKIGLTNNLSLRPGANIGDDTVVLLPITLDFPAASVVDSKEFQVSAAPYIGGGAAISTGDDSDIGFLVTGGVDVPISPQFTANAGVNVGFLDETEFGLTVGVGYNF
jgi:hypothetical protein